MTTRRWILTAISFLFAFGASAYIIRSSWSEEGARVALPLWAHLACFAAAAIELVSRSMKIRLSAAAIRIPLDIPTALRVSLGGDFGGAITPARSGAEPARFVVLREFGVPTAHALVILFLELALEMLSLGLLAVVLALAFSGSTTEVRSLVGVVAAYAAFVIGGGAIGYMSAQRWSDGPAPSWVGRLGVSQARWLHIQRSLRALRDNVAGMRHARWWVLGAALASSILHIVVRLAVLPIVVYSLGARGALGPLVLWPMAITYTGVLAPAPAGGGLVEVAFRGALNDHIPARILGAALLWWRVYTFYLPLLGGAIVTGAVVMRSLRRDAVAEMITD
jgi:hypothetical protein